MKNIFVIAFIMASVTAALGGGSGIVNPTTNASFLTAGTLASARLVGPYTGITGLGSLTGLTLNGIYTFGTTANVTAPGQMAIQSTTGPTVWCKTGSVSDCQYYDNSGTLLWNNPTGTNMVNFNSNPTVGGVPLKPVLSATTAGVGGAALLAGACSAVTVAVTSSTTAMAVVATPVTYPGDGIFWHGYVSTNGTVTVKVCASVAATPTSSLYNVRVIQ